MAEPRITRDRDDIEAWADEHDAVPVREGDRVRLVPEENVTTDHERLDWDAFYREVDEGDHVVTYRGDVDDRKAFEVSNRDKALDRVVSGSDDLDREEAEQRLIEGETITGTVTETTVVEETIVEEATLDSEVVDRDVTDRNVVNVELLDRECQSCDVVGEDPDFDYAGTYGTDRFLTDDVAASSTDDATSGPTADAKTGGTDDVATGGTDDVTTDGTEDVTTGGTDDVTTGATDQYDDYPFDVTVDVRENCAVTVDERERYSVATRLTDVDVTGTEEVEDRDLETEIDVDAVHQQLLTSDLVDVEPDVREDEVVDTETYDIESEFRDDDVLTTYLTSRRRFRREISERTRLTTEVVEGDLIDRETVSEEVVETALTEGDAEYETDTEVRTDTEYGTDTESETDTGVDAADVDAANVDATDVEDVRVVPQEEDEGKQVINADGDELGEVVDAEDGVAYVDPHPSLTEKIMARLGAEENEDYYRLREDRIDRITDNDVVVSTGVVGDDLDADRR